ESELFVQILDEPHLRHVEFGYTVSAFAKLHDTLVAEQGSEEAQIGEVGRAERPNRSRVVLDPSRVLRILGDIRGVFRKRELGVGQESRHLFRRTRFGLEGWRFTWHGRTHDLERQRIEPCRSITGMQHPEYDSRRAG